MCSGRVSNILNIGNTQTFQLRLELYKIQNDLALRRVLVDPESKLTAVIFKMFSTSIELVDQNTRDITAPENVVEPPCDTKVMKGGSKLWTDFTFPELGDANNLPTPEGASEVAVREENPNHPFLSKEKATIVDKWVEDGAEADTEEGSEPKPDFSLPPEPIPEPAPDSRPPKIIGLKKRRVIPIGGKDPLPGIRLTAKPLPPKHKDSKVRQPDEGSATGPANPGAEKASEVKSGKQPQIAAARRKSESRIDLIDLFDDDIAVLKSDNPPMSFYQAPLEPLRLHNTVVTQPYSTISVSESNDGVGRSLQVIEDQDAVGDVTSVDPNDNELSGDKDSIKPGIPAGNPAKGRKHSYGNVDLLEGTFRRTMKQKAGNKLTKAEQKAKKQAVLDEVWGAPPPAASVKTAKAPTAPEPSAWKKEKLSILDKSDEEMVKAVFSHLQPVLDAARYFPGVLSLSIQLGMILVNGPPKNYTDRPFSARKWNALFRPNHGVPPPTSYFVDRLTTSGADADYVADMTTNKNGVETRMFSEEPSTRSIRYEFYCQARGNEEIVICVDQTGTTVVNRPEALLGSVNLHCPRNIWDMSVVVKGTQEYAPGSVTEVDNAVQTLIDKLYVFPDMTQVMMFTRVPEGDELRITKVFMRRSTMHRYSPVPVPSEKGKEPEVADGGSDTVESSEGLHLQITEVQNLYLGHATTDKTLFRARAVDPDAMVDDSRLWYEVSIVSPVIERVLRSNKDIDIGSCTTAWSPSDFFGDDALLSTESKTAAPGPVSTVASEIGSAGLGQMYRLANQLVEKIDSVGWANQGPALDLPDPTCMTGSIVARSTIGVPGAQSVAASTGYDYLKSKGPGTTKPGEDVDAVSASRGGIQEGGPRFYFW